MRRGLALPLLLLPLLARGAGSAASPTPPPAGEWPATPAGARARDYVAAFNGGDDAMKAFYARAFPPESLAARPPAKRLTTYRNLRESFGALAFGGVVKDSAGSLAVRLLDVDAVPHEFTFTVETKRPYRLLGITMKQVVRGHGGFGAFHH
jgi:hypothetical protein